VTHPHLTRHFTGLTYDESYYLTSERAKYDLESFMEDNKGGETDITHGFAWFLQQMKGLTGALRTTHTQRDNQTGFRHDIKLKNVLVFVNGQTSPQFRWTDGAPHRRAHDIWSLGCMYLEILVWYSGGQERLDKFGTDMAEE
ncbi:hypothetical protein K458DRAFT_241510, partial [Lentithecium fluviatile CBS 122367]